MKLQLVTYLDKIDEKSKILIDNCKKNNVELDICGLGIPWGKRRNIKVKWMKSYFDKKNITISEKKNIILLFIDGHDILLNNYNPNKIIEEYLSYNCDILYSTQKRRNDVKNIYGPKFCNTIKEENKLYRYNIEFNNKKYNNFFGLSNDLILNCGVCCANYEVLEKYINYLNNQYNNLRSNDKKFFELEKIHPNMTGDQLLIHYLYKIGKLNDFKIKTDINHKIYFQDKKHKNSYLIYNYSE